MKKKDFSFWLFLLPVLIAFTLVVFIPFVMGIYYSFTDWNGISSSINFTGIDNYINAFKDETFRHSFWFTTKFTIVSGIVLNVLGFSLALLLTQK